MKAKEIKVSSGTSAFVNAIVESMRFFDSVEQAIDIQYSGEVRDKAHDMFVNLFGNCREFLDKRLAESVRLNIDEEENTITI